MNKIKLRSYLLILSITIFGWTCEKHDPNIILNPSISILEPHTGTNWIAGTSNIISWSMVDITGAVKIELFKGTVFCKTIIEQESADTFYFVIPKNLQNGNDYNVKITSKTNSNITATSDSFALNQLQIIEINTVATYNNSSDFKLDINNDFIDEFIFQCHDQGSTSTGTWYSESIILEGGYEVFTENSIKSITYYGCKPDEDIQVFIPKIFSFGDSISNIGPSSDSSTFLYNYHTSPNQPGCPRNENLDAWWHVSDKYIVFIQREKKAMGYLQLNCKAEGIHLKNMIVSYSTDGIKIRQ